MTDPSLFAAFTSRAGTTRRHYWLMWNYKYTHYYLVVAGVNPEPTPSIEIGAPLA